MKLKLKVNSLGLIPREVITFKRMRDIRRAIQRYIDTDKEVPQEWVTEYFELDEWCRNNNKIEEEDE